MFINTSRSDVRAKGFKGRAPNPVQQIEYWIIGFLI